MGGHRDGANHMTVTYTIVVARPRDLSLLPAIELAAAKLLAGHAPEAVLAETTSKEELNEAQRHGHLWVALADDHPVGFAHVKVLEPGVAHLAEIDVHPEHGRRGVGRQLVLAVCKWAATEHYQSVSLTTFRNVAWNMPFYARLGFEVIPSRELSPALRSVVDDETRRGLDPARRVVMRRACLEASVMMALVIRDATLDERSTLEALQWRASLANSGDRQALLANADAIVLPDDQIAAGHVFVAERGGHRVGFAAVLPRDDRDTELDALFVEPAAWRQGIGQALVAHCAEIARTRGSSALHVLGNPHAEGFYLACGFRILGTEHTRFGVGYRMQKPLQAP